MRKSLKNPKIKAMIQIENTDGDQLFIYPAHIVYIKDHIEEYNSDSGEVDKKGGSTIYVNIPSCYVITTPATAEEIKEKCLIQN